MNIKDIVKLLYKGVFPLFRKDIKKITIKNKKRKYVHIDKGTPYTIVFENGLGTSMAFWDEIFLELSKEHSVFAHNRPFKEDMKLQKKSWDGSSDNVVNNMKKVLDICEIKAPYILVGHSLGGLYIQLFAQKYPNLVKAMVLVDATTPDEFADIEVIKAPKMLQKYFKSLSKSLTALGEILLTSPIEKEIPMIILSATHKEDFQKKPKWQDMIKFIRQKQEEYLTLYPWAKLTWVDSGHVIMYEKPEVVIDAIRELVEE